MRPTALLVRFAIRPNQADQAADVILQHVREEASDGIEGLLPRAEVWTATLFVERGAHGPALWWYVELSARPTGQWTDPVESIRESSLFPENLEANLADNPAPRVVGPARPGSRLIVHAHHPDRPSVYDVDDLNEPEGDWKPTIILAQAGQTSVPDVVLVRWKLQTGPATWFMRAFARFADWLDEENWLERKMTAWSEPVLEEEQMWTETILLERGVSGGRSDRTAVLGLMETADLEGVFEGFYRTDNLVARVSEWVLGWIIENPAQALGFEPFRTDFEPLVHAVNPDRV